MDTKLRARLGEYSADAKIERPNVVQIVWKVNDFSPLRISAFRRGETIVDARKLGALVLDQRPDRPRRRLDTHIPWQSHRNLPAQEDKL
jgi:hypothetical protein